MKRYTWDGATIRTGVIGGLPALAVDVLLLPISLSLLLLVVLFICGAGLAHKLAMAISRD